ncbi:HTH domain-containing protein [Enterococcus mundtii]|uniref:Transcriptional regulator n=2 Tax=Enterococcus mundtii TaxID=53346 RepID=A0AAI8WF13_ENTMU|nr:HTH domain-containing protein [Enterococcus mundtii]MBE9911501.1 HTH domain-containing protein [Enterococcus mundtii]MCA6775547.1 HTH domain-containing protein [Enterococcus mundtii]MRI72892.1 HTH domain-containing protein [Enterococcus mundtii]PJK24905.1 hypothetical protein CV769_13100 [Enterococcus mundtii]UBM06396.1 HTH domain-containing protein [Enterococcus mundtii]
MEEILERLISNDYKKRVVFILNTLERRKNVTVQYLAKSLKVTRRTITNDLKTIQDEFSDTIEILTSYKGVSMFVLNHFKLFEKKKSYYMNEDLVKVTTSILTGELKQVIDWSWELHYCEKTVIQKMRKLKKICHQYGLNLKLSPVEFLGKEIRIRKLFIDLYIKSAYLEIEDYCPYKNEMEEITKIVLALCSDVSQSITKKILALTFIRFGKDKLYIQSRLLDWFRNNPLTNQLFVEFIQLDCFKTYSKEVIFEECCFIACMIHLHECYYTEIEKHNKGFAEYFGFSETVKHLVLDLKSVLGNRIQVDNEQLYSIVNCFLFQEKIKQELEIDFSYNDEESAMLIDSINRRLYKEMNTVIKKNKAIQKNFLQKRCASSFTSDLLLFLYTNKACEVLSTVVVALKRGFLTDFALNEIIERYLHTRASIMYQEQLETIENPLDVDILVTNILPFPYQVGDKTKMFYLPEKADIDRTMDVVSDLLVTDFR